MEFYNFKHNNLTKIITESTEATINKNGEFEAPVLMSSDKILNLVRRLKADKEVFKSYCKELSSLEDEEIISFIKQYYDLQPNEIYDTITFNAKKLYTLKKEIKTNMLAPTNNSFFAKLCVLAKPGVKFSAFKTYTKEEINEMIANRDIVVVDSKPYKRANVNGQVYTAKTPRDILYSMYNYEIFSWLAENQRNTYEQIISDVNMVALKRDFEELYLPAYKKCIAYLTECAKTAVLHEQQEIKELQKQIQKSKNAIEALNDVQKSLLDTSKGR